VYTDASSFVDKHADITAQTMAITIIDNFGSHSYHGTRSDEASWDTAVVDLSGLNLTTMFSRLDSLNGTSAIVNQGGETLSNYNATKYSIDNANPSDKQKFEAFSGLRTTTLFPSFQQLNFAEWCLSFVTSADVRLA
jgi:hypothetical protein